jgi:GntR family transcriptional regulator/MocR family aminotransferase
VGLVQRLGGAPSHSKSVPKTTHVLDSTTNGEAHLNRRLYERLRSEILTGHFRPGAKLPSTRALAVSLSVSRNTVAKAFGQLTAEGYIRGRSGSGSYVARELPDDLTHPSNDKKSAQRSASRNSLRLFARTSAPTDRTALAFASTREVRPFQPGIPALDAFPYTLWTKLLNRQWKRQRAPMRQMLGYAGSAGLPALREAISSYLSISRGVQCQPEQIIVVGGIQQALHLIARVLLKIGDPVWVEEPGYFAAQAVFEAASAELIPVKVDSHGLNVAAGIAANPRARLVYTTPANQFPLGATMSVARRLELLRWAAKSGAWIVEDDYDGEFRYSSRPLPALQSLDRNGNVIYVGTLSKVLFPALRLGYMVVPAASLDKMLTAKFTTDWHSPTIDQAIVAAFINEGHLLRHIRRMRALYLERLEALLETAHSELNGAVSIARPDSGMHVVASLPLGVDDRAVAIAANDIGVSTLPMSLCYAGRKRSSGLILGYAAYTAEQMRQACRRLAVALSQRPRT